NLLQASLVIQEIYAREDRLSILSVSCAEEGVGESLEACTRYSQVCEEEEGRIFFTIVTVRVRDGFQIFAWSSCNCPKQVSFIGSIVGLRLGLGIGSGWMSWMAREAFCPNQRYPTP
ncbi:unnamed protein product, partial [Discosporangium mesarthrocarpum]